MTELFTAANTGWLVALVMYVSVYVLIYQHVMNDFEGGLVSKIVAALILATWPLIVIVCSFTGVEWCKDKFNKCSK